MPPFDPSRAPRDLALDLLAQADPVPQLSAWVEAEPAALAKVLHALLAELRGGREHGALKQMPLDLSLGERAISLDLLLLPSIFAPEAWGMTFLEGLLRKPLRDYRGKRMVELGTGSGWIALALLRFTELEAVLGVDLNPQAVLVSRLNSVLNGYDADGRELPDRLHARFRSAASDLLAEPRRLGFRADLIAGCIPQVIAPEESLDARLDESQALYDLSNYTTAQGLVEDQFGLGLNARALRESLLLLEPDGTVILNLAGRPGRAVVERMFRRRGFEPELLWRARVRQAGDTDIHPLVELEARTGSPFAFQLHPQSRDSVSARVAQLALDGGLPIYHELQVIEGKPRSEALFGLAAALEALGLGELWERVDLSAASDEQLRFVTRLAEGFLQDPRAPYPHEAGDASFRARVTDFLRKFHDLPLTPHEAFAGPSRPELLHALLLSLAARGERVVISASLQGLCAPALAKFGADPVWVHDDGDEVAELLPVLRPRLVLLAAPSGDLDRLLARCRELGALLVLDESERFVIGSRSPGNPGLAFLARNLDAANLAVMVGLIRSEAFPDVELGLLFSRHPRLVAALEVAAELSWSRVSCFHQAYYESLFDELLSFRMNADSPCAPPRPEGGPALAPRMEELLRYPAFSRPAPDADVIRLDYGENELPLPRALQAGILEGFLAPPQKPGTLHPAAQRAGLDYLRATRLPELQEQQLLLGMGTLPLLFDALRALRLSLGRAPKLLLPQGSYGAFSALARAAECEVELLPTAAPGFLAEAAQLEAAGPFDVLLLTSPANPSGAAYAPEALRALLRVAVARKARLIVDEVFGLLADLEGPLPLGQDRWAGLDAEERRSLLVLTGLSKEFAAGGLRLGLAASADAAWLASMAALRLDPLPVSVQVAAERLFARREAWTAEVDALRGELRARRQRLAEGLLALGFGLDSGSGGGLFLFADVATLAKGDPEAFVLALEAQARVRLNTPAWSATADRARACYSIPAARIDEALARLKKHLG